jgi:hypothetical protein
MFTVSPLRRGVIFVMLAIPVLYLGSRPSKEGADVADPSHLRLPSPDGRSLAILRRTTLGPDTSHPTPVDQLFIEPNGGRRIIVQPIFVAKWKPKQQYKIEWVSSSELQVMYPANAEVLTREQASGTVTIRYVPRKDASSGV